MLISSLPWYDNSTSQRSLDNTWLAVRECLQRLDIAALPPTLNRTMPVVEQWGQPGLVLSQCCGPDLYSEAGHALIAVAAPHFENLDCRPGYYYSYIITRAGCPKKNPRRFAINSLSSHSGYFALLHWLEQHTDRTGRDQSNETYIVSDSHGASAELVKNGEADMAAIDAHSWTYLDQRGIEIIDRTTAVPAPPYVYHRDCYVDKSQIEKALAYAIDLTGASIGISRIVPVDSAMYESVFNPNITMKAQVGE